MTVPSLYVQAPGPALPTPSRPRGPGSPAWPAAAGSVPALAAPGADFADPLPSQGGEDEVWMVSYMDIMTLLLTLFVLLFVYTRAIAPEPSPARGADDNPQQVEARRAPTLSPSVPAIAMPDAGRPFILPPGWLASLDEPPIPELMVRPAADAAEAAGEGGETAAGDMALADPAAAESETPPRPALPAVQPQAVGQEAAAAAGVLLTLGEVPPDAEPAPDRVEAEVSGSSLGVSGVAAGPAQHREPAEPIDVPVVNDDVAALEPAPAGRQKASKAVGDREQRLLAAIQASELGKRVEVTRRKDAVNLEVSDEILFDRGSATLKPAGTALLADLAGLLAQQAVTVSVEGHTDNLPIRNGRFASNWELSTARATTVTRELIAHAVDPARVRAIGHADTKPRGDNATAEGRARNRRVSLVLHVPAVAGTEPE